MIRPRRRPHRHSQGVLGSNGTADFAVQGPGAERDGGCEGLADAPTELVVTATVGNGMVPCFEIGGQAYCIGTLRGDPLIGGITLLGKGPEVLSKGKDCASKVSAVRLESRWVRATEKAGAYVLRPSQLKHSATFIVQSPARPSRGSKTYTFGKEVFDAGIVRVGFMP